MLPEGVILASGNNQTIIGNMGGGTSATVNWTVVFQKNESYVLSFEASGYDSNGDACTGSGSTTISVVPEFSSLIVLPLFMAATLLVIIVYRRKPSG